MAESVLDGAGQVGGGWSGAAMVRGAVMVSPCDGKGGVRHRVKKRTLKGQIEVKIELDEAVRYRIFPKAGEGPGGGTGGKSGRKVHNWAGRPTRR